LIRSAFHTFVRWKTPFLPVEKAVDNVDNLGNRLWTTLCTSVNKYGFCTVMPVISRISEMKRPLW